jgi:PAS domain S-box-containing protein
MAWIGGVLLFQELITHQIEMRHALYGSEARFPTTFENVAVGIAHADTDGKLPRVNKALCRILGYQAEELLTKSFQGIAYPDDLAGELAVFEQLRDGKIDGYSVERRNVRKDGTIYCQLRAYQRRVDPLRRRCHRGHLRTQTCRGAGSSSDARSHIESTICSASCRLSRQTTAGVLSVVSSNSASSRSCLPRMVAVSFLTAIGNGLQLHFHVLCVAARCNLAKPVWATRTRHRGIAPQIELWWRPERLATPDKTR